MLELYTDYLLSSFGATTATGLSATLEGAVSHDQVTRFLSREDYDSKTLWQQVKPMVRVMEQPDGVLIFDDTIEEKPHTDENELISWHFDHSQNRSVKGINILNCVYHAGSAAVPVAYELIRKPLVYRDAKTGRLKRKSEVTKNELMRRMLRVCQRNQLQYRYVLADSWFSARENLDCIRQELDRHFVVGIKSALSYAGKLQGHFSRIDSLDLPERQAVQCWLRGLDFPVRLSPSLYKQGRQHRDNLASSDLDCDGPTVSIYQKRWKVETFHKTLKSNAALAKSPTRTERTQSNHCFMSIYAAFRLEGLRLKHGMNHFALRAWLYLKAIRHAFDELQLLKAA